MLYNISKKDFSNKQLTIKKVCDNCPNNNEPTIIDENIFFDSIKEKIENLNIKKLVINDDYFYYNAIIRNESTHNNYVVYNLFDNNKKNINEYSLTKSDNYYIIDDCLVNDIHFKNQLEEIKTLYKKYQADSIKEINELENNVEIVNQIFLNADKIYNIFKNNKDFDGKLDIEKKVLMNTYQFICNSDYIKNSIENDYNKIPLMCGGTMVPLIIASPVIFNTIASNANLGYYPTMIVCIGGVVACAALGIKNISLGDKILNSKYKTTLQSIKNYLENNYDLVYDENKEIVKTLKKSI